MTLEEKTESPTFQQQIEMTNPRPVEAEEKMLKTCKLEGAHYAAMKQFLRELQESI